MKESGFVKQNIDKWKAYEAELNKQQKDSSTISRLFIQITDDLAYARTYYRNRSVRVYLNDIAQLLFNDINRKANIKFRAVIDFWKIELPVIMYKVRFELLFSFLLFSITVAIGIITSIHQPEFARNILGNEYVDMTIKNIETNDPMAVYKSQNGLDMFLGITVNNIYVAFITFILGLFFGIGTLFSLLQNGIMMGTFQYFFIERGLFKESFLTIWQHGTLEISAIVIAGAAGFTIGRGLISPGSYTRFQSLRLTARRGLKIMLGLTPVFVFAAFIEGFFTRHTDTPDIIRISTIVFSLFFVIFYFVIYPILVVRKHPEKILLNEKVDSLEEPISDFSKILNNEMLFGSTLKILKKNFSRMMLTLFSISVILGLILTFFEKPIFHEENFLILIKNYFLFFNYHRFPLLIFLNTAVFVVVFIVSNRAVKRSLKTSAQANTNSIKMWRKIAGLSIFSLLIQLPFFLPLGFGLTIFLIILPFFLLIASVYLVHEKGLSKSIAESFELLNYRFGSLLFQYFILSILCAFLVFLFNPNSWLVNTPLATIFRFPLIIREVVNFISWNLNLSDANVSYFTGFIFSFFHYFFAAFCLFALFTAMSVLYYTLNEIRYAGELINRINLIGNRKTVRGYEID